MTDKELDLIRQKILKNRMLIPMQNREKFDVESQRVFRAIELHGKMDASVSRLLKLWDERVFFLSKIASCHFAPPALIREHGESGIDYLKRCFDATERC